MGAATLVIRYAGPLVTVQDGGRPGHMRFGVPRSGPMDRLAMNAANVALGNNPDATVIEVSMGGLALECTDGAMSVAIAGGGFDVDHAGHKHPSWTVLQLAAGEKLTIRPGSWGSWAYLAFAGMLQTPSWLGSTATHSQSGFGGGTLQAGMSFAIAEAELRPARGGEIAQPDFRKPTGTAHVVLGPQDHHFQDGAVDALLNNPYRFTEAYDRMGVRLKGPPLPLKAALSIPSEPIVNGSLQVSGDGVPTLLLADHQSTGGYPKIATVVSSDMDGLAQMRAGDAVRFKSVSPEKAVTMAREHAQKAEDYLTQLAMPRLSLTERLLSENLISGVVDVAAKRQPD